jgi:transglutaminase-like putative cysteine protease
MLKGMEAATLSIPDGVGATRETLKHMRDAVRRGVLDPQMRPTALKIVSGIPSKAFHSEVRRVFNWVRDNITYRLDATEVEQIHDAKITIAWRAGDCDDMCIVLATLLMCLGHTCRFIAVGFGERGDGMFTHVVLEVKPAGEGAWIALDATEPNPMGWFPPNATNIMRLRLTMGDSGD